MFWPAFVNLLLAWYEISVVQIIYAFVRPGLRIWRFRGYRHWGGGSRGRRPSRKGKFPNPLSIDPSEEIGKAMGGWQELGGWELVPGEIWFWSVAELINRAFLYWSILDLSTEFLYRWSSGVAGTRYCHARDDAVLLAGAPGYPLLGIFGWDAVGILDPIKERNITFFNGFGVSQNVGPGQVGIYFTATHDAGDGTPGPWIQSRMRCLTGPRAGVYRESEQFAPKSGGNQFGSSYDMGRDEVWIGEIRVNGAWHIHEPRLWCHGVFQEPVSGE